MLAEAALPGDLIVVKKLFVVFILVGLVAGAATYYRSSHPRAPHYPVAHIVYGPIAEVIRGTGLIEVRNPVVVGSALSLGEVTEVSPDAEIGRAVKKGQKLIQLDETPAKFKLDHAKAQLQYATSEREAAKAALDGATGIVALMKQKPESFGQIERTQREAEHNVAVARMKTAEGKLAEAQTGVRAAEALLSNSTIKSPVDGIIIDRKVVRGQGVGPQLTTPLFIIAPNMEEMRVLAQIAQTDISKIHRGQKATIALFTSGEKRVERTAPVVDTRLAPTQLPGGVNIPGTVFYSAVIDVPNSKVSSQEGVEGWELRPGMTADVTIYLRPEEIAWKVPKDAIELDLDAQHISPRAKARLDQWDTQKHPGDKWKRVWVLDNGEPWPVFLRVVANNGEKAIEDDQFNQFFEWDWGEGNSRALNPTAVDSFPPVIVNKPETTPGAIDRLLKSFKPAG